MRMLKIYHTRVWTLWFSAIILCLASCNYDTDDIVFSEIENDLSNVQLAFQESSSTISVSGEAQLNFNLELDNRTVKSSEVFLDETLLEAEVSLTSDENYIAFNTMALQDGLYTLRLVFEYESGSSSLASKLGKEFLTIELTQKILIDNVPVLPVEVVHSEVKDGALEITWNKFRGYGFEFYRVLGHDVNTNVNDTTMRLYNYNGGQENIVLGLRAQGQSVNSVWNYEDDLNINIVETEDRIELTWDPNPYTANFSGYDISLIDGGGSIVENESITDGNQTTVTFVIDPMKFPSPYYRIAGSISGNTWFDEKLTDALSFTYPRTGDLYKFVQRSENEILVLNFTIRNWENHLLKYDLNTGDLLAKIEGGLIDVSNDGSVIFQYKEGVIYKISPETFNIIDSHPITRFPQSGRPGEFIIDAFYYRNNDKLFLSGRGAPSYEGGPRGYADYYGFDFSTRTFDHVYDFNEESDGRAGPSLAAGSRVSDDGRYLYGQGIFDLETGAPPDYAYGYLIPTDNRLLKFDEAELYTTEIDGSDRVNLGIDRSGFNRFEYLGGNSILAYKDEPDATLYVFNANEPLSLKEVAKRKDGIQYTISDNYLLAVVGSQVLYLRELE